MPLTIRTCRSGQNAAAFGQEKWQVAVFHEAQSLPETKKKNKNNNNNKNKIDK
jgi:hypothetical protein